MLQKKEQMANEEEEDEEEMEKLKKAFERACESSRPLQDAEEDAEEEEEEDIALKMEMLDCELAAKYVYKLYVVRKESSQKMKSLLSELKIEEFGRRRSPFVLEFCDCLDSLEKMSALANTRSFSRRRKYLCVLALIDMLRDSDEHVKKALKQCERLYELASGNKGEGEEEDEEMKYVAMTIVFRILIAKGDLRKAEKIYEVISKYDDVYKREADMIMNRALLFVCRGKNEEALTTIISSYSRNDDDHEVRKTCESALTALIAKPTSALKIILDAITKQPRSFLSSRIGAAEVAINNACVLYDLTARDSGASKHAFFRYAKANCSDEVGLFILNKQQASIE